MYYGEYQLNKNKAITYQLLFLENLEMILTARKKFTKE
jgi:hypothetical protein